MTQVSPILLDCTLRDGGYYTAWDFSPELVRDYLHAMAALGMDYVELGYRSLDRAGFKGGCAYTTDSFVRRLGAPEDLKLGAMVNASELAKCPDGVVGALSSLFRPAAESPLTLVRIACRIDQLDVACQACAWLKNRGYTVGINLMQIADCNMIEIETAARRVDMDAPDVLYFADSMGSMDPARTSQIVAALRQGWSGALGIHAHDNMDLALANSLRAVADGVAWVDGTVTGMGRGPGNVKTEHLAIELTPLRKARSNFTPLLAVIAKHFKPMQAKYGWGTNPYYYLAGKYGIHPTYIQEMLSDSRYSDDDLLAIIEHLRRAGGKSFSVQTLETGRHFYSSEPSGTWAPSSLIAEQEVLVLGAGPSVAHHRLALEDYIRAARPIVIALNTQAAVSEDLIDIRAASHPVRLLADSVAHLALPQPLATPASMLPESVRASLEGKRLLDFGLAIRMNTFHFGENYCVLPTSLVIAYVLAIAASGKASRVLLAGFDGYSADDPRVVEVEKLLSGYQNTPGVPPLLAITPTRYQLPATSVYSLV